ncbi:unnamed protein product [Xylocopa violacea]|uniref:Dynein regulatory complex subunit 2 n=1 Tax=Xylocopa violacea TaxID=135666 RepID=A0ABP1NP51_XYLVO
MVPKPKPRSRKKPNADSLNLKRDAFFRGLELSVSNTERYRSYWREMLERVKMPDMWKKVEISWQTLEHAFDLKDYSVSLLLDSLQEADEQRCKTTRAHLEIVDRSLKAHETRLEMVDAFFYGNLETALQDKTFEFENIACCRNKREIALRRINLLANRRSENTSNTAKSVAISKVDAFVEDGKNETRLITAQLQKKLENLWNDLRNVLSEYRKNAEHRGKGYEAIRKKDQIDRQTINRQYLRISTLLEEIAKFRENINSSKNEFAIQLQQIMQNANYFYNVYRETYRRFVFDDKINKGKAVTMSVEYNRTVKHLNELTIKAERILAYMQMCRKYETQDEKILPTIDNNPVQLSLTENQAVSLDIVRTRFSWFPISIFNFDFAY